MYLDYDIGRASSERIARGTNLRGNLRNRPENRERERDTERKRGFVLATTTNRGLRTIASVIAALKRAVYLNCVLLFHFCEARATVTDECSSPCTLEKKNHSRDRVNRPQRGRRIFRNRQLAATKS